MRRSERWCNFSKPLDEEVLYCGNEFLHLVSHILTKRQKLSTFLDPPSVI